MTERDPLFRNRARAESFGPVAAAYDRHRPSYPGALVQDLLMSDPRTVLDVGCGTGKAGRLFAAHGLRVLGVEIDEGMAAVARGHGLEVEVAGFEQWDDRGRRFDLLISAQAWHWVDPVRGAARAHELVRPGGAVALFWNLDDAEPTLQDAFDEVYARSEPELASTYLARGGRAAGRETAATTLAAAGFVDVRTRAYPWQRRYGRDEWLDLLATQSNHVLLDAGRRTRLFEALGAVVDRVGGGEVTARYSTHLITGRRAG